SACTALPIPGWLGSATTIVLGLAAGLLVGSVIDVVGLVTGGLIGLAAGVLTATVHALFGQFPSSERPTAALAAAMLPVAVSGIPVYVVGRLVLGSRTLPAPPQAPLGESGPASGAARKAGGPARQIAQR